MTKLQRARKRRNLTNGQIARILDCSESYVSKLLSGSKKPKTLKGIRRLNRLREILGVEKAAA